MKPNLVLLAKLYISLFSLTHLDNVISLLGINENLASAPHYLSFWGWHIVLLLVHLVFPILTVLLDNYALYTTLTGVSLAGILVRAFRVFTWITDLYLVLVPLYALVSLLSLVLAVENVATRSAGEILGLRYSQF